MQFKSKLGFGRQLHSQAREIIYHVFQFMTSESLKSEFIIEIKKYYRTRGFSYTSTKEEKRICDEAKFLERSNKYM